MPVGHRSFIVLAALLLPTVAAAQPPSWDEAAPLGRAEAVREALARNPELRAARAAAAPLRERAGQERGLMPPRVEAQIWRWPLTTVDPRNVDMYMFMIEQELPGRGKRAARVALAQSEHAAAAAEIDEQRLAVAASVRRAYAALGLARRDLVSALETARSLRQIVRAAEDTYGAGAGTQAAVVRALLEATRVDERAAGLRGEARAASARLNALLGRPVDAPIGRLDEPLSVASPTPARVLVERAAERHPDVRAAEAALRAAEHAVILARQAARPDWMAQGGYMLMPGEAGAWTASVGVTWPGAPWARRRIAATIAEAGARRQAAGEAVEAARARVRLQVQEAVARIEAAEDRRAVLRTSIVPQALHLAEATRLSFETGQGGLLDALEARQVLLEAELDEARAAHEVEQALADLDEAAGDEWLAGDDIVTHGLPGESGKEISR